MLTIEDVAAYLKLKPQTIYKWAQTGKVPGAKFGKEWRFRRSAIERWIDDTFPPLANSSPFSSDSSSLPPRGGTSNEIRRNDGEPGKSSEAGRNHLEATRNNGEAGSGAAGSGNGDARKGFASPSNGEPAPPLENSQLETIQPPASGRNSKKGSSFRKRARGHEAN